MQALYLATQRLAAVSDSAHLDAELLLAAALHGTRTDLHRQDQLVLTAQQQQQFENLLRRRLQQEPIAYILQTQEFYTLVLKVTPDVLIPRPDTEILIETVLRLLPEKQALWVADLGTGSGAIALTLAKERPNWQVVATDNSSQALALAEENAAQLALTKVQFYQGKWCAALPPRKFAAIVSNPPYIAANEPELVALTFEPKQALIAHAWGLADIARIIRQARYYLQPRGWLVLEHGYQQAAKVRALLQRSGYQNISTQCDLAGHERSTIGQWVASNLTGE